MTGSSEYSGGFIRELGEAARRNPVSAALIGMGAVWLFAGRSRPGEEIIRRSGIDHLPDVAREAWEGTSTSLRSGARSVRETAEEAADALRGHGNRAIDRITDTGERLARGAAEYAEALPDQATNAFDDASSRMTELFKSQPLALGAVGLVIGAAIAAAVPTTQVEAQYLGETSDLVKDKARELAGEGVERAGEVVAAVADEARQQGLTGGGLKSAATDLSNKAGRVAKAVTGPSPSRSGSQMPAPGAYSGDQIP
jgi:hypothetical protein